MTSDSTSARQPRLVPLTHQIPADDTLGVLRRGRGTCSSKHRFLAALAHECGQGCVASSSAIMSISTQAPNGSCATLTALREWMPRSPNT